MQFIKEAEGKIKYQFPVKEHAEKIDEFIGKYAKVFIGELISQFSPLLLLGGTINPLHEPKGCMMETLHLMLRVRISTRSLNTTAKIRLQIVDILKTNSLKSTFCQLD